MQYAKKLTCDERFILIREYTREYIHLPCIRRKAFARNVKMLLLILAQLIFLALPTLVQTVQDYITEEIQ
jgi:hypothetical protein